MSLGKRLFSRMKGKAKMMRKNGARKVLIVQYETEDGKILTTEMDDPPIGIHDQNHYQLVAKGVLRDRDIEFTRVVEISILNVIFSEVERGLELLKEVAEMGDE